MARPAHIALLCVSLLLSLVRVQAQEYTYTIYFDTSVMDASYNAWWGDGEYYSLYVQVYSSSNPTTYYTTGTGFDGAANWDACKYTGTSYLYSWTYTGSEEIPTDAVCTFQAGWSGKENYYSQAVTFVNGATYFSDGTYSANHLLYYPSDGTTVENELSEFTVTCLNGLSINSNNNSSISVTRNWTTGVYNLYVIPDEQEYETSLTFKFYTDETGSTSTALIPDEGADETNKTTYTINFPEGYFLFTDESTSASESTTYYFIDTGDSGGDTGGDTGGGTGGSGAYSYTIYFEYGSEWWDAPIYVQVWSGESGNETYYTTGSFTYWENCDECSLISGTVYSWTYSSDEPLPDGVKCEFKGSSEWSWDTGECDFVNGHIYSGNGWHYEYGTFAYDIYYGGSYHSGEDVSEVSIVHKEPKWCGMSDVSHDTFNKDGWVYAENNTPLQAANIYVDTLYVKKGTDIDLDLPYRLGGGLATNSYQRWFDFRTDGNYRYGENDDLLTPSISTNGTSNEGWNTVYRFANGYASGNSMNNSSPLISTTFHYPTDAEFSEFSTYIPTDKTGYIQQPDNDYYIVACDVSIYTDFENFGKANDDDDDDKIYDWTEPTLAGRAIYYIVGVDGTSTTAPTGLPNGLDKEWLLLNEAYQGGTDGEGKKYLEEYEITYPARRTSNNTLELVTLSKDARAYIVPGKDDTPTELSAKFADNDSGKGFVMVTITWEEQEEGSWVEVPALKDERRVIQFYNTNGDQSGSGAPWNVDDGTTATILVTKTIGEGQGETTYNIARYKLTFKDNATPLTQTQVAWLDSTDIGEKTYWWKDMTYRSPNYMKHNYDRVASLTFNYGSSSDASTVLDGQSGFHAFPMDWENTSYAFYDGSVGNDVNAQGYDWYPASEGDDKSGKRTIYTQWSMYSIVNDYFGYGDSKYMTETEWNDAEQKTDTTIVDGNPIRYKDKPGGDENDYWLYIDASDRPGSVAEITFEDDICTGTQIFGTALIKSASEPASDDAAVMFSIMGVSYDEDGNEIHTPIYRQCSSQIRSTTYLNTEGSYDVGENGLGSDDTGKGDKTNEWFQLYFSFLNTGNGLDYDHYALCIDNYCSSTSGGDYYFDEIQLYVVQPTFIVEQISPVCTSDDDCEAVRLEIDFNMLEARLGDTIDEGEKSKEDSQDDTVYFMIINMNTYNNYEGNGGVAGAIGAATVPFVYTDEGGETQTEVNYALLNFYVDDEYADYPQYDETKAGTNTALLDGTGYFYLYTVNGVEYLAVDCYANISPYTPYKILLLSNADDMSLSEENYAELFASCLSDNCEIASDFYLTSSTILRINGEAADPTLDYCAGQTVVVWPEVTYTASDGSTATLADEYFDWFFGTEEEYIAVNSTYKDDTHTNGVSLHEALLMFRHFYPTATELSEENMKGTTDEYGTFTEGMYNIIAHYLEEGTLVLYKQYIDVVVPEKDLYLVVQPIEVTVTDEDTGEETEEICFGYVPLTLKVGGNAPSLNAGFGNVKYPDDDYVPNLRIGLQQIAKATQTSTASTEVTPIPIYVNLRNATYVSEDETSGSPLTDHLGLYNSTEDIDELYLIGTDDPYYAEAISDPDFTQYDLPIGKIRELYAVESDAENESHMNIVFYGDKYPLSEGYTYIVVVNFEEKYTTDDDTEEAVGIACRGTFPIEIKVVPEYLLWQGDRTANWNNDDNWQRVSAIRINGTTDEESPYFTDGDNATDNGFVPMLFTKVVMPRDSEAELYMAGFKADNDGVFNWEGDDESTAERGDVAENPTDNIMYDLMVYEDTTLNTLKTERYRVNLCDELHLEPGAKVLHSEQLIYNKVWTDVELAQGPWTLVATPLRDVVSGDWYTKAATGTETAEYFTDITFNSTDNNRQNPMVYQRNWSNSGNTIVYTDAATGTSKTVPAYATTGWSSVYNDASVSQQAGEGFSIKASRTIDATTGEAENTDSLMFRFPKADTSYDVATQTFTRGNAGRLLISDLVDRSDPDGDDDEGVYTGEDITVTLTQSENNYYIIGNPFTAPMSMSEFLAANTQFVGYWTEATYGPVAGTASGTSWGTDDCLIEPYSAFFVTTNESDISPLDDSPVKVTFTKDMQMFSENVVKTSLTSFAIRAEGEGGTTSASIAYTAEASDDYEEGEDAVLMEDASWTREDMPLVYSVAGERAVSVNSLKKLSLIPIGVFADEGSEYTLTFVGVETLEDPTLLDTYENTETPLTEGLTLEMEGASHGRYFIHTNGAMDIEDVADELNSVSVYSPTPHTVVVSCDAGLRSVEVYSVGGVLTNSTNAGGSRACTMDNAPSGIVIVRASTTEGATITKKIAVK